MLGLPIPGRTASLCGVSIRPVPCRRVARFAAVLIAGLACATPGRPQSPAATGSPGTPGTSSLVRSPQSLHTREVSVFWLIGQSNTAGGTNGNWLGNPYQPGNRWYGLHSQDAVRIWWPGPSAIRPNSKAGWESYRTGILVPITNANWHLTEPNFGPEASFGAAATTALGEPVYLFKYVAVAPLHPDGPTTFSRLVGRESIFDDLFREWQRAVTAMRADHLVPRVRGVCWIHGESDLSATFGNAYAQNLTAFIGDVRTGIGRVNPDNGPVRFVIAEMHDRHVPASSFDPFEALIRAAQAQVVRTVPDVFLTDVDDLTLDQNSASWVHFDAPGSIRLGYRMFATWSDREEAPRR